MADISARLAQETVEGLKGKEIDALALTADVTHRAEVEWIVDPALCGSDIIIDGGYCVY